MSAAVLREAAALMRVRAEAATPGPWGYYGHSIIRPAELKDGKAPSYSAAYHREDAEHIASWHPTVALKVAKAFDQAAAILDEADSGPLAMAMNAIAEPLVEVARAYLNTP